MRGIKFINKGDYLNEENITVKVPGTGISPMHWDSIIVTFKELMILI